MPMEYFKRNNRRTFTGAEKKKMAIFNLPFLDMEKSNYFKMVTDKKEDISHFPFFSLNICCT